MVRIVQPEGNLCRRHVERRSETDQRLEIALVASAHGVVSTSPGRVDPPSTIVRQIHALQSRGLGPVVD